MKNHQGHKRAFAIWSQCWHSEMARLEATSGVVDTITLGFYLPGGGTSGEFRIDWEHLDSKLVPRLKAYDDAWSALANMPDLLAKLADVDNKNATVAQMAAFLISCGFADETERTPPAR